MAASGLIVVDKPSGWTSHQVVGRIRRLVGTRKVGHAGTLDPMATGVLLVGVERATRLLGHLAGHDKDYLATIRLGISTVTDDAEGDPVESPGAEGLTAEAVEAALAPLRGDIVQVPSAVSAIKVAGRRAYARVRAGEEVELAGRPVTVSRLEALDLRPASADGIPVLDVDGSVTCSSGTYVRALARDLGSALGTGGHLTSLRRTRVGAFTLADVTLDATGLDDTQPPALIPLGDLARRCFPWRELDATQARAVGYGQALPLELPDEPVALLHGGDLLALYRGVGETAVPVAVFVG